MSTPEIACWEIFELSLPGLAFGNPFADVHLSARFQKGGRVLEPEGFYDGAEGRKGIYRLRFMPDELGEWRYVTRSNLPELDGIQGTFYCVPPHPGVHGPVKVASTYHFAYADGKRFFPLGTTCYAWANQPVELQEQTIQSLATAPFNKLRMCIFPKDYLYNKNEPLDYAFPILEKETRVKGQTSTDEYSFDFTRFNPAFFRRIEQHIGQLAELRIEADVILFHPYDRWGFSNMDAQTDERYLRYLIARLAAYRNVWWSLANEYDIMKSKNLADWDRLFRIVQTYDPYQHLRSVHNWQRSDTHDTRTFYDHGKPWVTHCSIQHSYVDLVSNWRELYHKPVIVDECCYEGNLPNAWGNLIPQEMVRRFWEATLRGGYCTHGETYLDSQDVIWWAKGGLLKGQSPPRIAFLRHILEEIPAGWLDPLTGITNTHLSSAGQPGRYYLTYFGFRQPGEVQVSLPVEGTFRAEIIDTWEMTISPLPGTFERTTTIALPGKPYLALRIQKT